MTVAPPASGPVQVPVGPRLDGARRPLPSSGHRLPRPLLGLVALLLVALVAIGVLVWRGPQPTRELVASGTVESDEVLIGPEVSARILDLPMAEGRRVQAGDVVARLDDGLIRMQFQQATDPAVQQQLKLQADRYVLRSPLSGIVTRVPAHVGELAAPGSTLVAVADLQRLKLTVYVLERDLAQVHVGQAVAVTADPFPGRAFDGVVTSIATSAEFTPRNVQTQRDRLNLVFAIKVQVSNPDGALKAGLPVDVSFVP